MQALVQERADGVAVLVGHRDVEFSIIVEVTKRKPVGSVPRTEAHGALEGAVTQAEEDAGIVAAVVARHQVGNLVPVDVADFHAGGIGASAQGCAGLEGAVAVGEEDGHAAAEVGGRQVGHAIAIEVAGIDVPRVTAGCIADGRSEGSCARVEENADAVPGVVPCRQVELAVVVEVAGRH